jgi:sugar phosphate permease
VAVVLIGVAGIPGSTLAGWLSDRAGSRRPFVVGSCSSSRSAWS